MDRFVSRAERQLRCVRYKMDSIELKIERLLERLDELYQQLRGEQDRYRGLRIAKDFMFAAYQLGLLLRHQPELRESSELKSFLEQHSIDYGFFEMHHLANFLRNLEDTPSSDGWGDEISGMCRRRSEFELFLELYPELLDEPNFVEQVSDVDENLRQRLQHDAPLEKNAEALASHWWWHS